jgi:glucose-1-phosphate cytidylyltransferase
MGRAVRGADTFGTGDRLTGAAMKVVLFCGGQGMRLREYSESIPKPMVPIGYRPILWHVMKYYAHYGHKEFILCLGYRGDVVKQYFRDYDETVTNNFVRAGHGIEMLGSDTHDWRITLVDTGVKANIGQRLLAVRSFIEPDEIFLANYSDGLSDLPLDEMVDRFVASDSAASFLAVRPNLSCHFVTLNGDDSVHDIRDVNQADLRINGGFFVMRREVFDYIKQGEDLVPDPFRRMMAAGKLMSHRYDGFWTSMDTFKDRMLLEELNSDDRAPWQVWDRGRASI